MRGVVLIGLSGANRRDAGIGGTIAGSPGSCKSWSERRISIASASLSGAAVGTGTGGTTMDTRPGSQGVGDVSG